MEAEERARRWGCVPPGDRPRTGWALSLCRVLAHERLERTSGRPAAAPPPPGPAGRCGAGVPSKLGAVTSPWRRRRCLAAALHTHRATCHVQPRRASGTGHQRATCVSISGFDPSCMGKRSHIPVIVSSTVLLPCRGRSAAVVSPATQTNEHKCFSCSSASSVWHSPSQRSPHQPSVCARPCGVVNFTVDCQPRAPTDGVPPRRCSDCVPRRPGGARGSAASTGLARGRVASRSATHTGWVTARLRRGHGGPSPAERADPGVGGFWPGSPTAVVGRAHRGGPQGTPRTHRRRHAAAPRWPGDTATLTTDPAEASGTFDPLCRVLCILQSLYLCTSGPLSMCSLARDTPCASNCSPKPFYSGTQAGRSGPAGRLCGRTGQSPSGVGRSRLLPGRPGTDPVRSHLLHGPHAR